MGWRTINSRPVRARQRQGDEDDEQEMAGCVVRSEDGKHGPSCHRSPPQVSSVVGTCRLLSSLTACRREHSKLQVSAECSGGGRRQSTGGYLPEYLLRSLRFPATGRAPGSPACPPHPLSHIRTPNRYLLSSTRNSTAVYKPPMRYAG